MNREQSVFIGLALFELQTKQALQSIDELTRQRCEEVISARIALLPTWIAVSAPCASSAGLVAAIQALDALARRTIHGDIWQKAMDRSPLFWYCQYCTNLLELSEAMQVAVKQGTLTLRSVGTRSPLKDDEFSYWVDANLPVQWDCNPLIPDCAEWDGLHRSWPDRMLFPPGAVLEQEFETWAVNSGITAPGELRKLLGGESGSVIELVSSSVSPASNKRPQTSQSAQDDWTSEMVLLRYEQIVKELGTSKGARKQLIAETGIEPTKLLRMRKQALAARASPMAAMKSVLGNNRK